MVSNEILKERLRIKKLFNSQLYGLVNKRQSLKKKKSQHVVSITDTLSLRERFFYYIDEDDKLENTDENKKMIKDKLIRMRQEVNYYPIRDQPK